MLTGIYITLLQLLSTPVDEADRTFSTSRIDNKIEQKILSDK